mmetsp:Transcript_17567/g.46334  ORF Transcript_17567/g.46334 Transcript_17567/m.46334 type:complete len:104 (+) Transcript_17567:427-738(+)
MGIASTDPLDSASLSSSSSLLCNVVCPSQQCFTIGLQLFALLTLSRPLRMPTSSAASHDFGAVLAGRSLHALKQRSQPSVCFTVVCETRRMDPMLPSSGLCAG